MFELPKKRRGRGAQSNRSGRFETLHKLDVDDGWHPLSSDQADSSTATDSYGESVSSLRTQWREDRARHVITTNQSPDVPFDRSVNPYRGCEHGCAYCFARPSHTYLGHSAGLDFERLLYAKVDAAALLHKELGNPLYQCRPIAIGVNTDAYQPLEKRLRITRKILEVLLAAEHPVYLITKSSLIERDIDLLQQLAASNLVIVAISITSMDNELSHRLEPRAAAPHRRLRIVRTLSEAGIPVRVSVSPVIPALNEHEIDEIIAASACAGAGGANAILLRLPHELAQLFPEWLEAHYPLKKARVLKAIRSVRAGKLNDSHFTSRFTGQGPRADLIRQRFELACRRHGLSCGRELLALDTTRFRAPNPSGCTSTRDRQIPLF
ncbi:MAG: PA0069 family radical SAM protein [Granulosicoccus sp.]|nr:PA0069 family radical SAM protein [Granulosicoccus sp.]